VWTARVIEDDTAAKAIGSRKGVAPVSGLRIEAEDGSATLAISHAPPEGEPAVTATLLDEIGYFEFDQCPICLTADPTSREHVPQSGLGGQVKTLTCHTCNHLLGSRVEAELADWCFNIWRNLRVANPQVLGKRRVAELLYRQTDDGQFVLIPAKPIDPAVRDMLAAGLLQIEGPPPDPRRYCLAALKHAYLAACLYLREIPDTDHARAVRADLLAARDASSSELLPASACGIRTWPRAQLHAPQGAATGTDRNTARAEHRARSLDLPGRNDGRSMAPTRSPARHLGCRTLDRQWHWPQNRHIAGRATGSIGFTPAAASLGGLRRHRMCV
jgi:hypothetical protein